MKNINYKLVDILDGYWKSKQILNENISINAVYDRFFETGRISAFEFDWKEGMDNKPHHFWDSDVAKWMEGAAYVLGKKYDEKLEEKVEKLIDLIEKNQCEDGYFNIYYTLCEPENRFKDRNGHELYCAGHLFEAAVAYYEATGKDRFLKCMEKYSDYIYKVFVEEESAGFVTPKHEEIELALVKMYRCTKKDKFLKLAKFFLDRRGYQEEETEEQLNHGNYSYSQSHIPVREQREALGHAVRATYLYAAMADLAKETEDKKLYNACVDLFDDMAEKKMYITGGLGVTHIGEAFTLPYDMPNDRAYNETCASIGMIYFSHRMAELENNSKYEDIIERELYNGALASLSIDGKSFFYNNPLEINLNNYKRNTCSDYGDWYPISQRVEVFECSCCPPNINRLLASLGDYIYGTDKGTVYVKQFMSSKAEFDGMKVSQNTNYPVDGTVKIKTENVKRLCVRIPDWCESFSINAGYTMESGYAVIEAPDNDIEIVFDMPVVLVESDVRVLNNVGKVAVQRGPVIYCAEAKDNIENLHSLYLCEQIAEIVEYDEYFGLNVITVDGCVKKSNGQLYSKYSKKFERCRIKLIPYSCFANRGETNMCVWLNVGCF